MSTSLEHFVCEVDSVNSNNRTVKVKKDGDSEAMGISIKYPKYLSQNPVKGDRAAMIRVGGVRGSYEIVAFY